MRERQRDDLFRQKRLINQTHSFAPGIFLPPHCPHIAQVLFVDHRKQMLLSPAQFSGCMVSYADFLCKYMDSKSFPPIVLTFRLLISGLLTTMLTCKTVNH